MRTALTVVLSFVALLLLLVLYNLFQPGPAPARLPGLAYSEFIHEVDAGHIQAVTLQGSMLTGSTSDSRRFQVYLPSDDPAFLPRLLAHDVQIGVRPPADESGGLLRYVLNWLPLLLLLAIFGWGMRRMTKTTQVLADLTQTMNRERQERR